MALTLDDLHASPDHYLQAFDGDDALFVPMDRAAYHRSIFLDGRIAPAAEGSMRLPIATLLRDGPRPAATAWIFHVAHCGSTLLARALDRPSGNIVLREPFALRQLAFAPSDQRLALVASMLSKRYRADAPTIVKANVPVNFLLPALVAIDPDARAIFLHLPLRDYLLAILRSDQHRAWLRNVTTSLAPYLGNMDDWPDAERAAALWLAQMQAYAAAIRRLPQARSLNAETFFAEPRAVVAAAAGHCQIALSKAEIDDMVGGPLFATYSKNPAQPFDNDARLARRRQLEAPLAAELSQAEEWMAARAAMARAAEDAVTAVALTG